MDIENPSKSADAHRVPPYHDREFVERDFTPTRIEEQGLRLLYRALNVGRAIAFVGSGVSSAYGRPSWGALIEEVKLGASAKRGERLESSDGALMRDLYSAAEAVDAAAPIDISDPDLLPLRAQLYRNIETLAAAGENVENDRREDALRTKIKEMTGSDDYAAQSGWRALFAGGRVVPTHPQSWRAIDVLDSIMMAVETAPSDPAWRRLREALEHQHRRACEPLSGVGATPRASAEERLLVPLVAASIGTASRRRLASRVVEAADQRRDPALRANADARRSRNHDPVRLLLEKLNIRRFLTTNYDFELEMGLERLGFPTGMLRPPPQDGKRERWIEAKRGEQALEAERALGERARSVVLTRASASELTNFAVKARPFDYEIFHLHGRAIPGEKEGLVVTERDYQATYLRNAPEAHVMDEALTAAMAGIQSSSSAWACWKPTCCALCAVSWLARAPTSTARLSHSCRQKSDTRGASARRCSFISATACTLSFMTARVASPIAKQMMQSPLHPPSFPHHGAKISPERMQ
ncbi:hypothetical protein [Terricaulis sp.]|uniref:hypothetical protein n=1 Tax=Terricaulis sp. TaxID=2768686 RepID=UPI002AC65F93|nr:hypothetical protein [Terricaulis sp.]MDZ4689668.1 hypothetical protein [Terricaulis sp.]